MDETTFTIICLAFFTVWGVKLAIKYNRDPIGWGFLCFLLPIVFIPLLLLLGNKAPDTQKEL